MTVESSLLFAILSAETVLFGMLVWKHVYVVLPVFTVSGILLCSTGFVGTVLGLAWPSSFASFFLVDIFVRAAFLLCTVAEIARNLIRWNRATSPFIPLYLALLVVTSSLLLLLAQWSSPAGFSPTQKLSAHALQLVGAVQIAAFLALAWWALLRRFIWPRTEFHLATGIGIQSFVCLVTGMLLTYQPFHWSSLVLWVPELAYLLVLMGWIGSFIAEGGQTSRRKSVPSGSLSERLARAEKYES